MFGFNKKKDSTTPTKSTSTTPNISPQPPAVPIRPSLGNKPLPPPPTSLKPALSDTCIQSINTTQPIQNTGTVHIHHTSIDNNNIHTSNDANAGKESTQSRPQSMSVRFDSTQIPPEPELNLQFELFMDNKLFKNDVKNKMRLLTAAHKWKLLCTESQQQSLNDTTSTTQYWCDKLLKMTQNINSVRHNELIQLDVIIRTNGKQWLESFIDDHGIEYLLDIASTHSTTQYVNESALRCIKSFMNNELGLHTVIELDGGVDKLSSILITGDNSQRIIIVDLLSVICWLSDIGHTAVIDSLSTPRFGRRFKLLCDILRNYGTVNEYIELRTRVMTFVNTLINSIDCIQPRVHTRLEFIDLGLMQTIEQLRQLVDSKRGYEYDSVAQLNAQLDTYEQLMYNDIRDVTYSSVDTSDIDCCVSYIKQYTSTSNNAASMLDTIHALMTIQYDDIQQSNAIWNNVRQIVTYAVGEDNTTISYDTLKCLLDKQRSTISVDSVNTGKIKELENIIEKQRQQIHELNIQHSTTQLITQSKIDSIQSDADKQLHELQHQIQLLQQQLNNEQSSTINVPTAPVFNTNAPVAPPMAPAISSNIPIAPPPPPPTAPLINSNIPLPPPLAPSNVPAPPPMAPIIGNSAPAPPMAPPVAPSINSSIPGAPPTAPGIPPPPGAPSPSAPIIPTVPKKINNKPNIAMKLFHWSVVPVNDITEHTFWKSIDDTHIKLDLTELESQFGNASKAKSPDDSKLQCSPSVDHAIKTKSEQITLVDSKRSYAVNIALARFKMTNYAIRDTLYSLDSTSELLSDDKLCSLMNIAPTADELECINDYDGTVDTLAQTEQFFHAIGKIPHVSTRIELLLFKCRFIGTISDIKLQLTQAESALHSIQHSGGLQQLCELILYVGNYMNGGTAKGGAYGFKLDTLCKLKSMRGLDNNTTLLSYIIHQSTKPQFKSIQNTINELSGIPDATRIDISQLTSEINKLSSSVNKIKTQLTTVPKTSIDQFHTVFQQFYDSSISDTTQCQERMKLLNAQIIRCVQYFGDDTSVMKYDTLLNIFNTFVVDWKTTVEQIEQKRLADERAAKQAADKSKRDATNNHNKSRLSQATGIKDGAVVESTLNTLSSANADELMKTIKLRRLQQQTIKPLPSTPNNIHNTAAASKHTDTLKHWKHNPLSPINTVSG